MTRKPTRASFRFTRLPLATLVAVALLVPAAAFARGYMTPAFRSRAVRPRTILLLPPHAEFIKEKVVMTDEMVQESAALELEAARALKTLLEQKGYRVVVLAPQDIGRTSGLAPLVKRMNDRYEEEWSKMVYRPKKVRESRYTTGDDALCLCSRLKVDGLALVRIQAVAATKGKAFLRYMGGSSQPHTYARLDLAIIDARQGVVHGYFSGYENTSLGQLTKKPAHVMSQAGEHALSKFPELAEVLETDEIVTASVSGEDEEGDPVSDFEALLKKSPSGAGAQK